MKQLFYIKNENPGDVQKILSFRIGEKTAGFSISNKTGDKLYELSYSQCAGWDETSLSDFFRACPSLNDSFYQVLIAYDFRQNFLLSSVHQRPEQPEIVFMATRGLPVSSNLVSELIPEWQLNNFYAVPSWLQQWLNRKFPTAQFRHRYSIAIRNINEAGSKGLLLVDFGTEEFTLLAAKNGRLLLAESYSYSTPEDVLFYLLKCCGQFLFSQKEVQLRLSGLIEKDSALFKEIYQYFINIELRSATWNSGEEYPAHFFTLLNDLARCAS
ncbi:MAG: DUF3822 family protein [Sphingobacteriales bacterium]|nr:DUF3822 family protein [Sphingobacteriales bacterium]